MNKFMLLAVLSLALVGCDRHEPTARNTTSTNGIDNDNTGKNVRDRDLNTITPDDQLENEADRTITQKIRQALLADESLTANAKNIKVVTINGVVTLRGPVASAAEKEAIARKLTSISGIQRVDNQLEITRSN